MEDHGISLNKKCRCIQAECPLWGNCVLCVQNHVEWGDHMPECMQGLVRESIESLARKVEFKVEDKRPRAAYWQRADKQKIVDGALRKHTQNEPE